MTRYRPRCLLFVLSFILFTSSLHADLLSGYSNYKSLSHKLQAMANEFPDVVQLESLGKTKSGRDLWLISLGAQSGAEKPAIAILGGIEADDVASSELCVRFIRTTAEAYGRIDSVTSMLDRITFYIVPRVNPDATEQLWGSTAYDRLLNANNMDLDHDGAVSEDGYDDLNGDGFITKMRISDPTGEWMADPQNPQLMRKADATKNEKGVYILKTEGIDNDNDGFWNEDPSGGVDFNQNFSFDYKSFVPGAGPHPVSEAETRAIADFLFAHANVAAVFSFSHNENLLHPWDAATENDMPSDKPILKVLADDAKHYDYISEQFKKVTSINDSPAPVRGNGNFSPWVYFHYGRWSFAAPAWWPQIAKNDSTEKAIKNDPLADERTLYNWFTAHNINGIVEWTAIDHPDFADQRVEVGGFLPGAKKNPPADNLDSLATQFGAFFYKLADFMPRLVLTAKVEALDKQVYRLTAIIHNDGYLPTSSQLGVRSQWLRPLKAEVQLQAGQHLVNGNRFYLIDSIPGGGAYEQSWLLMGKKDSKVNVVVGCPSVGSETKVITLK